MSSSSKEDLFDTALLLTLREELQDMKAQTDQRLTGLEQTVKTLASDIKKLVVLRTVESKEGKPAKERQPQFGNVQKISDKEASDGEGISSQWNYIIARKGGYNNLLHVTVHELLELGENSVNFLLFLVQKREYEVRQQLEQLQAEYQRLQGNQLQEHFRELWKSHYMLLKNKQTRTWKEEVFLAAFDAFIAWLQT
jgi:hypothetical protein